MEISITLPMTPYRVEVALGHRTYTVNLSPNSPDMRGAYFGSGTYFRRRLVGWAQREMRDTAYALTRDALMASKFTVAAPLGVRLSAPSPVAPRHIKTGTGPWQASRLLSTAWPRPWE